MIMKKLKKNFKWIVVALVIIIISVFVILICKNLFDETENNRLDGIEDYKITKKEINLVKEDLNKIDSVDKIDITTNYKIIKIFIELEEDIEFDDINDVVIESINNFSKKNLKFYDIEVFIDCLNEDSEIYPKIGYKHKSNSDFTWNR